MKKENNKSRANKPKNTGVPNSILNAERSEIKKRERFNIRRFEDLARKQGITLDQLLAAGIKAYLDKETREEKNKKK